MGGVGRFYSRPKIKNIGCAVTWQYNACTCCPARTHCDGSQCKHRIAVHGKCRLDSRSHVLQCGFLHSLRSFSCSLESCRDDPLFMCQIISSAIVNAPPPHPVTKMLMRTNFAGAAFLSCCASRSITSCLHSSGCIAEPQHTHAWRSASAAVGCGQLSLCTLANFANCLRCITFLQPMLTTVRVRSWCEPSTRFTPAPTSSSHSATGEAAAVVMAARLASPCLLLV